MKKIITLGLAFVLGILLIGCAGTQVSAPDTEFTCPEDNKWFACRSMDDSVPFCSSEYWVDGRNVYEDWLLKNCPGIEILE